jgi:phage N-6-adenine-methyltransferase
MNETLFNIVAGETTSDDYYTPKWVFDALNVEFDIDVAAPAHGIPWLPAKRWFSQADDGLAQDWAGQFVWMNPPFSKATPWVEKFIENNNGIALLVVSRSKWFAKLWDKADAIVSTPYDLKFVRPDGSSKQISFQTFLFALGQKGTNALNQANVGKTR